MNLKEHPHLLKKFNCPLLFVFFILTLTIMHAGKCAVAAEKVLPPGLLNHPNKTSDTLSDEQLSEEKINELLSLPYLQGNTNASKARNTVLYKKDLSESGPNFYLSSGTFEIFLIDMKGNILHTWHTPNNQNTSIMSNAILLKNGEIIFSRYKKTVIKMDKHSNVLWSYPTDPHHTMDIDEEGNIYLLSAKDKIISENISIQDNFIEILNPDGKLIKKISLYGLFNNYPDPSILEHMMRIPVLAPLNDGEVDLPFFEHAGGRATNIPDPLDSKKEKDEANENHPIYDVFHANSIQVFDGKWTSKSPAFQKGNLLVSLRNSGFLLIINPRTESIEWLLGPKLWRRGQHDAQLLANGNMLIFNNLSSLERSKVTEFDPLTQKIIWEYSIDDGKFYSEVLGAAQRLPGGNTLIIQGASGRAFEVTPAKEIVWEFYNPNEVNRNLDMVGNILMMQRLPNNFPLEWAKTK